MNIYIDNHKVSNVLDARNSLQYFKQKLHNGYGVSMNHSVTRISILLCIQV